MRQMDNPLALQETIGHRFFFLTMGGLIDLPSLLSNAPNLSFAPQHNLYGHR